MKKSIAIFLAVIMLVSLSACGKKDQSSENGFIFKNDKSVEIGTPDTKLDPQEIYSKIQYTPEMFYGAYALPNWFASGKETQELTDFRNNADYIQNPYDVKADFEKEISSLPMRLEAGPKKLALGQDKTHNWLKLTFATKTSTYEAAFAYEIQGNKLILTGVDWEWNNDTKVLKYSMIDSIKLEYDFSFSGRGLTLSNNGKSVTLYSGKTYSGDNDYIFADKYVSLSKSSPIDGKIRSISMRYSAKENSTRLYVVTDPIEGNYQTTYDNAIALLEENGLFTMTVPFQSGTKTYQFVYFICEDTGLILTDGTNTYYYFDSYSEYYGKGIENNVSVEQVDSLNNLSEEELSKIAETTQGLYADLEAAFKAEGLAVTVDKANGEIAMDSTVLFGGDSAEISDSGKEFLTKFINAYASIVSQDKYKDFISKTMIEGHIAPIQGVTYDGGLPLSEQRANNVRDYCLSVIGSDTDLANKLEAVGYSNSKPILNSDGSPNYDASRRVSFRFIINVG